jgi:hypothetical protein
MKNCLFAMVLLSLGLEAGCAKGGNGVVPPSPSIDVSITSPSQVVPEAIYPTESLTLTATVSNSTDSAVTWTLSGAGTLTPVTPVTNPATATYVAPSTAGAAPTITATLVADTSVTGSLPLDVVDVTTDVAPATLSVGNGLAQQFVAVAVPDNAPQTFSWTCTANGVPCANFLSNTSGLAVYKAEDACGSNCVQISAASTIDPTACSVHPTNCTSARASLVTSRINGTYAFRFSGYDGNHQATAVVGTFTASNETITSGAEFETTSSSRTKHLITGGSYTPTSADPNNSNNAGTLTLTTGTYPEKFQVVLDGAGDIEMIESDGHGTGSGIAQVSSNPNLFKGDQTYAFGFTGVDSEGNRVGYIGLLPMNGSGAISGGQMDANDNGIDNNICGVGPCSITQATYTPDPSVNGLWQMNLTAGSNRVPMVFDFFIASGTTSKTSPLTFYVITDPSDTTNPAVSGTMVLQDSTQTYNNAAFNGVSVAALTGTAANGANANVSLTLGTTDGGGNFTGSFDQNNNGTILSVPPESPFSYTYAATGTSTTGRYTFQMLGNPTVTPAVAPLPFVLYASGANRGFLLDQSSSSVMTGTMNPQGKGGGDFAGSELPGTFAAVTTSSASSGVDAIAANLLITWVNTGSCTTECVSGTQYDSANPAGVPLAGANPSYALQDTGNGTMTLTAPSAEKYVIYVLDTSGCSAQNLLVCAVQDFLMMDVDKTNPNASIIFAKE